ncbi:MAG TPA: peptide chain release factor N(5)-glutamine methyltransferase [Ignavibacteria bacterium]
MDEKKLDRLLDILNFSSMILADKGFKNARLNVELLLSFVLKCNRLQLYIDFEKPLSVLEKSEFKSLLRRRLNYEPLQYILGKTNFFGYEIQLSNSVLIPRQETELLVECIINDLIQFKYDSVNILEIGSGSGCISIALSKELKKHSIFFNINSIDISSEAIQIAELNKKKNNCENLNFTCADVFNIKNFDNYNYIISNPPYISVSNFENLDNEITKYEPEIALTDFSDGFTFYKHIFTTLKNTNSTCKVFCEIGYDQKDFLENYLNSLDLFKYKFYKDYSGLYRIIKAEN